MINRTRRLLYGIALVLGAGHAGPGQAQSPVRHTRPAPPSSGVNLQTAAWLAQAYPVSLGSALQPDLLDTQVRRSSSELAIYPRNGSRSNTLLTATVIDDLGAMKNGVGIDFKLPDFGNFYFNLYTRKNPRGRGKRWQLSDGDAGDPPVWSMGGAVNVVRQLDGGRRLVIAPQLTLNLERAIGAPGKMQATLQRANWNNNDPLAGGSEKVIQLTFNWRF